jgi:hypothetical protein
MKQIREQYTSKIVWGYLLALSGAILGAGVQSWELPLGIAAWAGAGVLWLLGGTGASLVADNLIARGLATAEPWKGIFGGVVCAAWSAAYLAWQVMVRGAIDLSHPKTYFVSIAIWFLGLSFLIACAERSADRWRTYGTCGALLCLWGGIGGELLPQGFSGDDSAELALAKRSSREIALVMSSGVGVGFVYRALHERRDKQKKGP